MLVAVCMENFYIWGFVHALHAVHEITPYCRGQYVHVFSLELFCKYACTKCCLGNMILVHNSPV